MSIDELRITSRAQRALRYIGVETVEQLLLMTEEDILRCPNIGTLTLDVITQGLAEDGFSLRKKIRRAA